MADLMVAYQYSPYTTANYLVAAFERLGHRVYCIGPGQECAEPPDWHTDAYIWVEAGGGAPRWVEGFRTLDVPCAAWFIDAHSQIRWHRTLAHTFDYAFVAQKAYVDKFDREVVWLPVACDPDVHTPPEGIEPECDVVFVGHLYGSHPWYQRRRDLLEELGKRYDLAVYEGAYGQDMAAAHARGRVVFNVSTAGDLNMRVFEGLCSGRPLVTDAVPGAGLSDLFTSGLQLFAYRDDAEAFGQIDRLLSYPSMARLMGESGRKAVLAGHTYEHRAKRMLEVMGL
jgi:glycosyltransferase involved in cell wall biosynthesis